MPPKKRGKKDKRQNQPQREQKDPEGNEQGHRQGGGPSSVNPALERDGIFPLVPALSIEDYNIELGASQNISGVRSTGHRDNRRNTTAGNQIRSSGSTTTSSTIESTRTYNESKHNEFIGSEINGPAYFGDTNNYSQHGPPMDSKTRAYLEQLVQTMDWVTLSRRLSVIDQDKYRSTVSPFNPNKPDNFWITKNIDFMQWESADSQALLLSAPPGHGTTEVCSHVIDLAKKKASQTNSYVLYFFASSTTDAMSSTNFAHTLLQQIVCCSNVKHADYIATTFLSTLLRRHFQRPTQAFKKDDELDTTIENILRVTDDVLIEALLEVIKKTGIQELSVVIDGMSEDIARLVFKHSMRAIRKLKALFTIDEAPKYGEILDRMMCIEYDKERKECLRSLYYDDTRYGKISEEHHGSLEWLWEHPQYLQWSTSATSSLLYIEGKPGSGKSTLAKYLLKNLEKVPNARSSTVAHYFYSLRGTVLESTHENMLKSILYSILDQDESAFCYFQHEFRDFQRRNHSGWPYQSLKNVLSSLSNHPSTKPLYLILDAMDESNEADRRSIIELICKLCSEKNPYSIKIFLASRPVAELKHRLQKHHLVITLQDENKRDISKFSDDFLKNQLNLSGKILGEAADYITENAQGVFVWVSLVKTELVALVETGCTNAEILACLKRLPTELEDFYAFMFKRLERGKVRDIQDGIRLFRFVLFARRPLIVMELRHALAIPDDRNTSYEEFQNNIISALARRIEHCGGNFLEIKVDETVQLMHQTAREFIIRTISHASQLQFEITDMAHRTVAATWVRYLILCFTSPCMQERFSKITSWAESDFRAYAEYLNEWPLIEYTLRFMKEHLHLCGSNEEVTQLVTTLIGLLTDNQASYFLGRSLGCHLGHSNGKEIPVNEQQEASENIIYSTLNAAAEPKLPHVVDALLLTCAQNCPDAEQKTSLIISAQKGLVGATQLFLDKNIEKDAKDNLGRTALHYAAESGSEAIVQLLTKQKADKRIKDNQKKTALHIAVEKS